MKVSSFELQNSEAATASGLIGSGLTLLRKMDFTKPAYQSQAFFSLSIGLERMMKLIIIYDYRTLNNNQFPNDKYLRKSYMHDLVKLFAKCEAISASYNIESKNVLNDSIYKKIIAILSEFSNQSRYYNLNYLSGSNIGEDCLQLWENEINKEIMKRHCITEEEDYKEDEEIIINKEDSIEERLEKSTIINFKNWYKNGKFFDEKAKYSMFYVYNIVHFLTNVLYELSAQKLLPFIQEHFRLFLNTDDNFILERKFWDNYEVWKDE